MPFHLPPKWYRDTTEKLVDELEKELGKLTAETAWRYMYALVGWFQSIDGQRWFHLNDRLTQKGGQEEAKRGEDFLRRNLAPKSKVSLEDLVDQIGKKYDAEWVKQGNKSRSWERARPNTTGNSMEVALQVLIHRINGVLPSRAPKLNTLRGFELAPPGYHRQPDLVLFTPADFRLIISTKWTLRKDRLGTYLHEAYFYKQRRPDVQIAFVVSEYNLNILENLVRDPLVERVYHLHLPMLLEVHEPFAKYKTAGSVPLATLLKSNPDRKGFGRWLGLSERLFDLSTLFQDVDGLKPVAGPAPEPEETPAEEDQEDEGEPDDTQLRLT
jgi:hypothetical protein